MGPPPQNPSSLTYTQKVLILSGPNQKFSILGSAAIGALSLCFSDSFWFNAVEAEVYAMSTFFTTIAFLIVEFFVGPLKFVLFTNRTDLRLIIIFDVIHTTFLVVFI